MQRLTHLFNENQSINSINSFQIKQKQLIINYIILIILQNIIKYTLINNNNINNNNNTIIIEFSNKIIFWIFQNINHYLNIWNFPAKIILLQIISLKYGNTHSYCQSLMSRIYRPIFGLFNQSNLIFELFLNNIINNNKNNNKNEKNEMKEILRDFLEDSNMMNLQLTHKAMIDELFQTE